MRVPNDPPAFNAAPWFTAVLQLGNPTVSATTAYTYQSLQTTAQSQWGLGTTSPPQIIWRLREVRVWGPVGSYLTLTTYDPTAGGAVLATINDTGNMSSRPTAGYVYPLRIQTSGSGSSSEEIFQVTIGANAASGSTLAAVRVLVSWRFP